MGRGFVPKPEDPPTCGCKKRLPKGAGGGGGQMVRYAATHLTPAAMPTKNIPPGNTDNVH